MLLGIDEVVLFFLGVAVFLAVIELGYRFGLRHSAEDDAALKSHTSVLQSALLGLLALLLGFTFAMAVSRFDLRRTLVLEESNAIGKAFWRLQLVPTTRKDELSKLLRQYVDTRIEFHLAAADDARLEAAHDASARVERQIWESARAVAAEVPQSVATTLFIQSVNDMIDVNEKRRVALENHVPVAINYLLLIVSIGALGFIAYGTGLDRKRRAISTGIFASLIALVLTFIVDMDRPQSGLITITQESMVRLKAALERGTP